jgi:hypothetical protein
MTEQDKEEKWLDGLAGRGGERESQALRAAMLARKEAEAAESGEIEQGLERLLFRLRREGLLGGQRPARRWVALALAATLVAGIGVAVWPLLQPEPEAPVVRGMRPPQELFDADPASFSAVLAADLRAAGLTVDARQLNGGVLLEAPIADRADPRLGPVLERHRLKLPASGPLVVYVAPRR